MWDLRIAWPWGDAGLACALALQGQRDDAIRMLEEATTGVNGTSVRYSLAQRVAWLGEAARSCGRPQEARRLGDEALRLARYHRERGNEAWAQRLLGEIAAQADPPDLESADAHYGQALARAEELGMRPLVAHCHLGLGKLYRRAGQREQVRDHLTVATTMYREMGMGFWLAQTEMLLSGSK
jgi:tetratricopeptide (TPR) repeat protein